MNILAIDTSGAETGVVLLLDTEIHSISAAKSQAHADHILEWIESLLEKTTKTMDDINYYAYCAGPGSYTGLRIGAGIIEGFNLVNPRPIVNISSLAALAYAFFSDRQSGKPIKTSAWVSTLKYAYGDNYYLGQYQMIDGVIESHNADVMIKEGDLHEAITKDACGLRTDANHFDNLSVEIHALDRSHLASEVALLAREKIIANADSAFSVSCMPSYLKKASDWLSQ